MTRNYTTTRDYLLQLENKFKTMNLISRAESETRTAGENINALNKQRRKEGQEYSKLFKEISEKIERVEDDKLRMILKRRFLKFQSSNQIKNSMGWSDKYMRNLSEQALMNMEIILVQDGVLTFVDPMADMVADFEDGKQRGYEEGRKDGYWAGYDAGYRAGYERGEAGLSYEDEEDEEDENEEDFDEDFDDEVDDEDIYDLCDFCDEENL